MNTHPQHPDEERDLLKVWKKALPEDEEPPREDQVIHGKMFGKVIAYLLGILFSVTVWVYAGRIVLFLRQWLGL